MTMNKKNVSSPSTYSTKKRVPLGDDANLQVIKQDMIHALQLIVLDSTSHQTPSILDVTSISGPILARQQACRVQSIRALVS
jgi:hypothetical protein